MTVTDKSKLKHVVVYEDDATYIREFVNGGNSFADKLTVVRQFYESRKGKTFAEGLEKSLMEKMRLMLDERLQN